MFPQILIVDDEPRIVKAARLILSKKYQTISTGNIEEIETIITENDIHLVLIDYNLKQEKNGIEIAEQIRDNHPLIQVLLFTGNTDYAIIKRAINSESIHAFINKPIMRDELIDVVGKHFEISLTKRNEFEETLQNIKKGTLSELDLTNFGYSKPLLNLLIKETIDVKHTNRPRLIGYNISNSEGTVVEDFIDDSIVIHNNFYSANL